jgi:hypothetical protein
LVGFTNGGLERSGDLCYKGEVYALYIYKHAQKQGIDRKLIQAAVHELLA